MCPLAIQSHGNNEEMGLIRNRIGEGGFDCFLLPFYDKGWELMALCPKSGCIASFCCQGKGKKHKKKFTDMIDTAIETYQVVKGMRSNTLSKPKWVYPKCCNKDAVDPECGLFVMRHMLELIKLDIVNSFEQVLHMDKPYSSDDIADVRRSWAKCFLDDIRALRRSPEDLLKIAKVFHGHFVFEAVPGLAAKVTSKPKHGLVQPRLIKRLFHKCSSVDELLKFFDSKEPIECYEKLEPTESELIQYTWWGHVADDVRSSVKYIHRESHFTGKAKELKRTREQSPVPEREQGYGSVPTVETGPRNNSVPALELRPTKRTRTTESPNVDSEELLTSILEGVRRDNELLVQRVMREVREIQEMASRKADDMKSEIEEFKKTVEELRRRDSYVPFEDYAQFENTPSPSPTKETPSPPPPPPEIQKTRSPPPSVRTPSPPEFLKTTPADEVFVPFEDDFLDEIAAFTDNMEYARVRGVREPSATPILRVPIQTGKPFSPIRVTTAAMMKQQEKAKDSVFRVRPAVRPPKDSDEAFVLSDRHREQISSYIAYLSSDSEEERDIGNIIPETAAFFKEIEDYTKTMEIQVVDAYLRILNFSPEFLGCHPEGKGKFTILGHFFCDTIDNIFRKKYPREIIPDGLKGKAEKLNLRDEQVNILLNIVLGKTTVVTEKWGPLVPFTEVQKIYTVWLASGHFYPLIIDLVRCEVWIFDSMAICTDKSQRENRYLKTLSLRRILPAILKASGFYRVRKDLKPVFREWDLRFADKDYCFRQEDILSCGPFALKMMDVLVSRRALPYITEQNIGLIRSSIAERIFSYSKPAKTNVPLL
ncbi:hypothetical protein CASFOL_037165 [Castilleja foliolosa]|uniref:Ubiquitin-like protease family profile domain-containing protein n=1 Tax=Castilleja foliolosa TaxID=1961234 RepID=A0ABD3BNS7_9LAMI